MARVRSSRGNALRDSEVTGIVRNPSTGYYKMEETFGLDTWGLSEKTPDRILGFRKKHSLNRDLLIYVLYRLGVYRNEEIGEVFGVGYTAVSEAAKRGREYLRLDKQLEKTVNEIPIDI